MTTTAKGRPRFFKYIFYDSLGFVENLTTEQCHHIIYKAFSNRGGKELMQSFLVDDTGEHTNNHTTLTQED